MNKALSALALARRAGKLVIGFDAVMKSVQKRETVLVVLAEDLSSKTAKEARFFCEKYGAEAVQRAVSLHDAETVLGKRAGVFGITDRGFQRLLKSAGCD